MSSSLHDRPTATELLDAVASTLDNNVLPAVEGGVRHDVRVAANLCRIIARELGAAEAAVAVAGRYQAIVGDDSLEGAELLAAVSRMVDSGELAGADEAAARAAALAHVTAKLAVSQPGYDDSATS